MEHHYSSIDQSEQNNNDTNSLPMGDNDDDLVMAARMPQRGSHHHHHSPWLQALSIFVYVASWVANAETIQGICNGSLTPHGNMPYNKPGFLTWLSFNLMIVGFAFVWPWIRRHYQGSFWYFFTKVWVGTRKFWHMIAACTALSFWLIFTHIFYVIGLDKISVASLNAAYQIQAACTLALSVWVFGDAFAVSQLAGIAISVIGVVTIVLPPLWIEEKEEGGSNSKHNAVEASLGVLATVISAAFWGCYQVAWRALHESKLKEGEKMTSTEELIDTIFTLAVIGVANLTVGWTVLPVLHWIGFEPFELPAASLSGILTINAIIEYTFNALIAIAIHVTSPIATSLTAPLTIPLSWLADLVLYGTPLSSATGGGWGLLGALFIVAGLYLLELKPSQREKSMELLAGSNVQRYVEPPENRGLVLD